jgi:type VI secretion system protein ImpF
MAEKEKDKGPSGQRLWRKGDRAKISVMQVFRESYFEHDARKANASSGSGEVQISKRSQQRREGVSETQLRAHLEADLNALLNTIQLGSTVDLEDTPHVSQSIVNYGFRDLSGISLAEINTSKMIDTIRQSLLDYEPRLVGESVEVTVTGSEGDTRQRLSISVSAELMGDPVDIPLDFDAEVDLGAGKLRMSKLRVQM